MTTAHRAPGRRTARVLALTGALLLPVWLGGCDTVDSMFGDSPQPTTVKAEDTSNAPYPNLASVPDKPPPVSPEEIRQRTVEGLAADRANAQYSNSLTASGTAQPAAAPPAAAPPAAQPAATEPATTAPATTAPTPAQPAAPAPQPQTAAPPVPTPSSPPPPGVPPAPPPQPAAPPPPAGVPTTAQPAAPQPAAPQPAAPPPVAQPAPAPAPAPAPQTASTPSAEACALAEPWERDLYCKDQPPAGQTPAPQQQATTPPVTQPTPAPAPAPAAPPAQGQVGGGRVQMVGIIFFAHGSAKMDARDAAVLGEIAKLHRQYGGIVRVVGYASTRNATGGQVEQEVANLTVSLDRAQAIAMVLINNGVPATAVVTEARPGGAVPVNQPYMPTGEAGERRAEIYLEY